MADDIMVMEGNGLLNGSARELNRIVLADDPVAADATCVRLMGLDPDKIVHLQAGAQFLGNSSVARIDQLAEAVCFPELPFQTVPEFEYLRLNSDSDRPP